MRESVSHEEGRPSRAPKALAIAGVVAATVLALASFGPGQVPSGVPEAQAAPGISESPGYFPAGFGSIGDEIQPPIDQF
jgi:hypothetical protein